MKTKTAIVTGATRGIGYAISRELVKDFNIISVGRNIRKRDVPGVPYACDVTKTSQVRKCVQFALNKFNRIDLLINCAGVMLFGEIGNTSDEEFDKSFEVNVKGTFLMCREVLPIMRKQRHGYIINMSSVRGITAAPLKGIYSATKFAIRGLTETIILENKEYNIKATSLCPGIVWTESAMPLLKREKLGKDDVVLEEDIVRTVRYLLSLSPSAMVRELVLGGMLYG